VNLSGLVPGCLVRLAMTAWSEFNQCFGNAQALLAAAPTLVVGVRQALRGLALIRDAKAYGPSDCARTAGAKRHLCCFVIRRLA
jgi:hypothetical protein